MAQEEPPSGSSSKSSSTVSPWLDFAMGRKRLEEFAEAQAEFMQTVQEANQKCLDRFQSEANLASEFVSKLAASHSISDTATACQEWGNRHLEMFSEDSRRVMTESQKLMQKAARFWSNGGLSK